MAHPIACPLACPLDYCFGHADSPSARAALPAAPAVQRVLLGPTGSQAMLLELADGIKDQDTATLFEQPPTIQALLTNLRWVRRPRCGLRSPLPPRSRSH